MMDAAMPQQPNSRDHSMSSASYDPWTRHVRRGTVRRPVSLQGLLLWTLAATFSYTTLPVQFQRNGESVWVSANAPLHTRTWSTRRGWLSTRLPTVRLGHTPSTLHCRSTRSLSDPRKELQFLNPQWTFEAVEAVQPVQRATRDGPCRRVEAQPNHAALVSETRLSSTFDMTTTAPHNVNLEAAMRGGAGTVQDAPTARPLVFWENMVCGATSRSMAQTIMHPANTMKTILQNARGPAAPTIASLMQPSNFRRLTVGAGANFLLSLPHGAVNFAVLEWVRSRLGAFVQSVPFLAANEERFAFGLDFVSSSISTVTCSIVSTPQMMITDNIMAGNYPNLMAAISGLASSRGLLGFYSGWWPGLVGKIPSYALTWTFFQQLKTMRRRMTPRPATDLENSAMGCLASAATVCLMIPMDTIKTRLVSQAGRAVTADSYTGIIHCAVRVWREEGVRTFYRGLPPRLVSVVPMIGIQFGVYEFMKRVMLQRQRDGSRNGTSRSPGVPDDHVLEEAMMEVAASPVHPFPAPQFSMRDNRQPDATKKAKR